MDRLLAGNRTERSAGAAAALGHELRSIFRLGPAAVLLRQKIGTFPRAMCFSRCSAAAETLERLRAELRRANVAAALSGVAKHAGCTGQVLGYDLSTLTVKIKIDDQELVVPVELVELVGDEALDKLEERIERSNSKEGQVRARLVGVQDIGDRSLESMDAELAFGSAQLEEMIRQAEVEFRAALPFLGDDIFVLIAAELDARMLGRLGCAAQRFWVKTQGNGWSVVDEGARRRLAAESEQVRGWVSQEAAGSWLRALGQAEKLLKPLRFAQPRNSAGRSTAILSSNGAH